MPSCEPIRPAQLSLGLLAGGRATRLGGLDKAWLQRGGIAQVLRWRALFAEQVSDTLVSANRDLPRYHAAGLRTVTDVVAVPIGPLAGLAALADGCRTPWLLTLPVDLLDVEPSLLASLVSLRGDDGAVACDADGEQPLVALWRVAAMRVQVHAAIRDGIRAVHAVQRGLRMPPVRLPGHRFGNLNTPADLAGAGITSSELTWSDSLPAGTVVGTCLSDISASDTRLSDTRPTEPRP